MKVIIAGSRTFNNYNLLAKKCDHYLKDQTDSDVEIVSGCCRGADKLGEKYAKTKEYKVKKFPANWYKHGKKAGYLRNIEMAKYSVALIAFWDHQSKGTKNMIELAQKYNLKIRIVKVD